MLSDSVFLSYDNGALFYFIILSYIYSRRPQLAAAKTHKEGKTKRRYINKKNEVQTVPQDPQRIMKRGEVAALFGISRIRVDQLAAKGILRKVTLPGLSRSLGFIEAEVRELLVRRQEAK